MGSVYGVVVLFVGVFTRTWVALYHIALVSVVYVVYYGKFNQ